MNRLLYLTTLTLFTALIPGLRCLYRKRHWSAALFFAALLAVFIASLNIYRGQTLVSSETLLFSIVFVYGVHFIALSASLVAAAERWNRSKVKEETQQFKDAELTHVPLNRESARQMISTNSKLQEIA